MIGDGIDTCDIVADLLAQRLGERVLEKAEEAARAVAISEDDLAKAIARAANSILAQAPTYARIAKQLAATRRDPPEEAGEPPKET